MLTSFFLPYISGIEYAVYHLSRELSKQGVEVEVITPYPGEGMKDENLGFRVHRLSPSLRISKGFLCPSLLPFLLGREYHLYHLHLPFHFGGELATLGSILKKTPVVVTHHQDWISQNALLNRVYRFYDAVFTNWILKKSVLITASTLERIRTSPTLRNHREKTVLLRFGVDTERFYPGCGGAELRAELGLEEEKVVLFVGKLDRGHRYKGLEYLIRAFRGVLEDHGEASLVVVGSGELLPFYRKMAREEGIQEKTLFTGGVSHEKLPRFYDMCDVFVLPSLNEAYGIVLVEAMACGKPVIATSLPGPREVVQGGERGALVEPGNVEELRERISYLLENPAHAQKIGRRNADYARREFDWKNIAGKLREMYRGIT